MERTGEEEEYDGDDVDDDDESYLRLLHIIKLHLMAASRSSAHARSVG